MSRLSDRFPPAPAMADANFEAWLGHHEINVPPDEVSNIIKLIKPLYFGALPRGSRAYSTLSHSYEAAETVDGVLITRVGRPECVTAACVLSEGGQIHVHDLRSLG